MENWTLISFIWVIGYILGFANAIYDFKIRNPQNYIYYRDGRRMEYKNKGLQKYLLDTGFWIAFTFFMFLLKWISGEFN